MQIKDKRAIFNVFRSDLNLAFDTETAEKLIEGLENDIDINIDIDGEEYRLIHEDSIGMIWTESLIELLQDCYEIPEQLENYIDYDKWAADCKVDGMGHHFSSYDGNEYEAGGWYIFRTN